MSDVHSRIFQCLFPTSRGAHAPLRCCCLLRPLRRVGQQCPAVRRNRCALLLAPPGHSIQPSVPPTHGVLPPAPDWMRRANRSTTHPLTLCTTAKGLIEPIPLA